MWSFTCQRNWHLRQSVIDALWKAIFWEPREGPQCHYFTPHKFPWLPSKVENLNNTVWAKIRPERRWWLYWAKAVPLGLVSLEFWTGPLLMTDNGHVIKYPKTHRKPTQKMTMYGNKYTAQREAEISFRKVTQANDWALNALTMNPSWAS